VTIYLFVVVYTVIAFQQTSDATMFVPLIGGTVIMLAALYAYWSEYRRTGLSELEL